MAAEAGTSHGEEASGHPFHPQSVSFSVDEGLAPLPPGLLAQAWSVVRDSTLGTGGDCAICLEEMGVGFETTTSLVVQLGCKHTYCELCVRQLIERATEVGPGGGKAACPQCRVEIG